MSGQEKSPVSEFLAGHETGLGFESLQSRLQRYGAGKTRALDMAKYITEFYGIKQKSVGRPSENQKLAAKLSNCADFLIFKRYLTVDEVRLHAANFCKKHLLCPFCAMRRGTKYLQAYKQRLDVVLHENPKLRAFMVTLTVKDGESLSERFAHLRAALKKYTQQRRDALKGQRAVEYAKAFGGVHSIEIKRGKNSGLWHPHVHMIWLCEEVPNASQLSKEWLALTGDSYIVDVREFYGESVVDGFLEVFKYALKFSDMRLADNWEAYQLLKEKRLVDSFGLLRGVKVPKELTDEDIDEEFVYLLYYFARSSGYNFVTTVGSNEPDEVGAFVKIARGFQRKMLKSEIAGQYAGETVGGDSKNPRCNGD
ncbi:protein rep [Neisseria lactamica]|uniref:protein rep n=1 Tax=Neisseria lactamica TaxID=486 RepID=UPI000BB64B10|nr:protein rep [Neisseria lactamica]